MKWLNKYIVISILALICCPAPGAVAQDGGSQVVARGDGVKVHMDFVRKMEEFYLERIGHHAEEKELIRSGVEHWLFAHEAMAIDLAKGLPSDPGEMTAKQIYTLHTMYLAHLTHNMTIGEDVLLSYYKAFPQRFQEKGSQDEKKDQESSSQAGNSTTAQKRVPFAEAKSDIRKRLLQGKLPQIKRNAFEHLVEKYDVTIQK